MKRFSSLAYVLPIFALLLLLIVGSSAEAIQPPATSPSGEGLVVFCDGDQQIAVQSLDTASVFIECRDNVPGPVETAQPTATAVPPTPEPQPTSEPPPPSEGDYGTFPNCTNGAVPAEAHSWISGGGNDVPMHIHSGGCVPAARENGLPVVGGNVVSQRSVSFNNTSQIEWARAQIQSDTFERHDIDEQCQGSKDTFEECRWYFDYTLPSGKGINELRISTNSEHSTGRGYVVLNAQVNTGGSGEYRGGKWLIARGWWAGTTGDYERVYLYNYMDLFNNDTSASVPTVSGTIDLDVKHDGNGCQSGALFINPTFHSTQAAGLPDQLPDEETGCGNHTYSIDTTELANGRHGLYFQTRVEANGNETKSALLVFVDVQN